MKTKLQLFRTVLALLALSTLNSRLSTACAQGATAFTYQGQLHDGGTNANGAYTMIFKLYDSLSGGNQIGSGITNTPTLFNGLFTLNLDFGAGAFNGAARWLDITVSNGVAQTLSPRVQVLPAPYAQFAAVAATVTNGGIMNAQLAGNAVSSTNIQSGAVTNRNLTANAVNATNIASGQVVKSLNGLTDNVILAAGANVTLATNGNTLQIAASGGGGNTYVTNVYTNGISFVPTIQVFRSSGTFIVPAGVTKIEVEIWGGGGGGGNGYNDGSAAASGGGGGGGDYNLGIFTVTPGSSFPVTVGSGGNAASAGGTSSFSTMSASGGGAGGSANSGGSGAGGAGGTNSGGLVTGLVGTSGTIGDQTSAGGGPGGSVWRGGVSPLGLANPGGSIGDGSGPAIGGVGGGPGSSGSPSLGNTGNNGLVIIYY